MAYNNLLIFLQLTISFIVITIILLLQLIILCKELSSFLPLYKKIKFYTCSCIAGNLTTISSYREKEFFGRIGYKFLFRNVTFEKKKQRLSVCVCEREKTWRQKGFKRSIYTERLFKILKLLKERVRGKIVEVIWFTFLSYPNVIHMETPPFHPFIYSSLLLFIFCYFQFPPQGENWILLRKQYQNPSLFPFLFPLSFPFFLFSQLVLIGPGII